MAEEHLTNKLGELMGHVGGPKELIAVFGNESVLAGIWRLGDDN